MTLTFDSATNWQLITYNISFMKKVFSFLIGIMIAEHIFANSQDFKVGNLFYQITSNNTVMIVSQNVSLRNGSTQSATSSNLTNYAELTNVIIPESVQYKGKAYTITEIGNNAFSCSNLISVSIPNTITEIGDNAFLNCGNLNSVIIPTTLKRIGAGAFKKCKRLESIAIPNSVTIINDETFSDCIKLKTVDLPPNIKTIGYNAFCRCINLESIEIPITVTKIEDGAFRNCYSLKTISIPLSVESIGYGVFYECKSTTIYCGRNSKPDGWHFNWNNNGGKAVWGLNSFFTFYAKEMVEKELNEWQKKGEFEKIETWKKRVTNETREAKIRELTQKAEKTFIETHQDKNAKFSLGEYDAENEVFLINNPKYGNLLVPVPIENAPQFKQQWPSISREIKCFIDNDTINIAEILFTLPNGEQYKYSNQASLNYEMTEIDYNFEPIELDLQTNEQPTTRGQQNIKSAKWTLGVSEVDIEIPTSNIKTDNTFAVIIANENYQKEAQVPFAVNDGRTFAEYCKKTLGIPNNNVHIVTDATLNNMKYEVRWLKQVIDAYGGEARVIFYYAGHGIPDEAQKTAYLLPVDGFGNDVSTGYKLDDLYSTLGNLPSKSVTVFLDACFSGANRNGEMLASARGVAIKAKSSAPVGNMVVFSAAQGDETAYPNNEQQHGMFTYYLLKKIKETAGNVTYKELGDYVTDNVRKQSIVVNGKSQTPTVVPSATVGGTWETWKLK